MSVAEGGCWAADWSGMLLPDDLLWELVNLAVSSVALVRRRLDVSGETDVFIYVLEVVPSSVACALVRANKRFAKLVPRALRGIATRYYNENSFGDMHFVAIEIVKPPHVC